MKKVYDRISVTFIRRIVVHRKDYSIRHFTPHQSATYFLITSVVSGREISERPIIDNYAIGSL